jgi:hypothetical protein
VQDLRNQETLLNTLSRIANQSLVQYEKGFVPLASYYDDFRSLIDAEDDLLNKRFKAVEFYAKLAKVLEDDSIFYNGLVL